MHVGEVLGLKIRIKVIKSLWKNWQLISRGLTCSKNKTPQLGARRRTSCLSASNVECAKTIFIDLEN
jgi:hypothetical protein